MFYEGCTIEEIRAFRELESEAFDFGEGEMRIEGLLGSEDAYYEMCLPEECGSDTYVYKKPKPKSNNKTRLNRHKRKRICKNKLDKLENVQWWAVSDVGTHKYRCYLSGRRKVARKVSDRKVRKYKKGISNGGNYRKIHDYWYEVL